MSSFALIAYCVLTVAPGQCAGMCGPQHRPLHHSRVQAWHGGIVSHDPRAGSMEDAGLEAVADFPAWAADSQPAAPQVVLSSLLVAGLEQQPFLASSDRPAYRAPVPLGPLAVQVRIPVDPVEPAVPEAVVLLLDGKPVEPNRDVPGSGDLALPSSSDPTLQTYAFNLPCPAPGNHVVQARYKVNSLWSCLSPPLRFEVRLPDPPRIVAISNAKDTPAPVQQFGLARITDSKMKIRLANIGESTEVDAYVDGKLVCAMPAQSTCCREVCLRGVITPGVHCLTVRARTAGAACDMASEPSAEVAFHYFDQQAYVLGPRARCETCRGPHPCASATQSASSSSSADAPQGHSQPAQQFRSDSSLDNPASNQPASSGESAARWPQANLGPFRTASLMYASDDSPIPVRLVALLADDQVAASLKDAAVTAADEATVLAHSAARYTNEAHDLADVVAKRVASVAAAAKDAEKAKVDATAALAAAKAAAYTAEQVRGVAERSGLVAAGPAKGAAKTAENAAWASVSQAREAANRAAAAARDAQANAALAQQIQSKARILDDEARHANQRVQEAAAQTRDFAAKAAKDDPANQQRNAKLAGTARDDTKGWYKLAKEKHDILTQLARTAEVHAQRADNANRVGQTELQNARQAMKAAEQALADARTAATKVVELELAPTLQSADKELAKLAAAPRPRLAAHIAREARGIAEAAVRLANRASVARQQAAQSSEEATNQAARADRDSRDAPAQRNAAEARIARMRAAEATAKRELAKRFADQTSQSCIQALRHANQAQQAARIVADIATGVADTDARAIRELKVAADLESATADADAELRQAAARVPRATIRGDSTAAWNAIGQARAAVRIIEEKSMSAISHYQRSKTSADFAAAAATRAERELAAVRNAWQNADTSLQAAEAAAKAAHECATDAANHAAETGQVAEAVAAIQRKRDQNEANARYRDLRAVEKDLDVLLAPDPAKAAGVLAAEEETQALNRIALADAQDRITRARAIHGPASPFYFASAAHFPIREFGPRGELLQRQGLIIYEDMSFRFDRDGQYEVRFRATTPRMPVTVQLQFQIQPCENGPWYTVTLAPMEFRYDEAMREKDRCSAGDQDPKTGTGESCASAEGQQCCGPVRECVCRGHSEILRRCYGEIGQGVTIRRSGTARFGFGLEQLARG